MNNLRKWLNNKTDTQLLEFWNEKILKSLGCTACPVGVQRCNQQKGTCDEVFEKWVKGELGKF